MRAQKIIIIVGILILLMGFIFHLQGNSIVGPETSFMYSNPEWIDYGFQIGVIGGVLLTIGIIWKFLKK